MTRRSRSPQPVAGPLAGLRFGSRIRLVAVSMTLVGLLQAPSIAQDPADPPSPKPAAEVAAEPAADSPANTEVDPNTPLYRDPDPAEGPRVVGPLLSARSPAQVPTPPPMPTDAGPFQPPGTVSPIPNLGTGASNGPEPIHQPLLIVPPSPPPIPALPPMPIFPDDGNGFQRSTEIKGPKGAIGTFAEWFHQTFLWPNQPYEYVTLPTTLLWKPPIANLREPQFYGIFHNIDGKSYIDTAIGAQFGLGRISPAGKSDPSRQLENEGLQLDVFGAVFTRFDPKRFLTAIDYRAGIPLTYKKGPWSTKLSYEHTSTHIGDEYSQAYHVKQKPLVLDEVVFGLSRYWGEHIRTYGQFGYAFNTAKETNANNRTRFDWGFSYQNYYDTGPAGRPYLAYDMDIRSYQNYTPNNSLQIGWQWVNQGRSVRLAFQYYEGRSMFGQFYTRNENWYGFGGYYNF